MTWPHPPACISGGLCDSIVLVLLIPLAHPHVAYAQAAPHVDPGPAIEHLTWLNASKVILMGDIGLVRVNKARGSTFH